MNTKAIALMTLTGLLLAPGLRAEEPATKNDKDKISYALGTYYGGDWKRRFGIEPGDLNFDEFVRAVKTELAGEKSALSEQETKDTLNKFQQELAARQQEKRKVAGEKNKAEGEKFLADNKPKPGIITLPSGLQYKVLTEGKGESPKPEDNVTVNYRGTLLDGTEFDSSAKAGKPLTRRANSFISGWNEALTHMKAGDKWQLFIPSNLAYGERGEPRAGIGPNATLLFDVELVSFETPPPPPPAAPAAPLTSDIIKVPSLEEMKKGAKIETIKAEDVEKLQKQQPPTQPEKK
jgi:FKBP-type peptidyl-prolyl cis-trans isomerase FklB